MVGVDELVVRRRDRGEDPEPAERILARERPQDARRDRRPADAVEPVAPGDDVALEHVLRALVREAGRAAARDSMSSTRTSSTSNSSGRPVPSRACDQVLHDLRLPVDRDRLAAGERRHVDPVPLARELQLDAVVHEALACQPLAHARLGEEIDDALLEHARADARLDVLAAAVLEDHRLDALRGGAAAPASGRPAPRR